MSEIGEALIRTRERLNSQAGQESGLPRLLRSNEFILLVVLVLELGVMALLSNKFLTTYNLLNMTRNFIERGLIALSMTLVIITAGVDLSVGSLTGLCAMAIGVCWGQLGMSIWVACLVAIAIGICAGLLNGTIIARLNIPPIIVTLATLSMFRGLAYSISSAKTFSGFPDAFLLIGQSNIGRTPIPFQLVVFVLFCGVFLVALRYTSFGRKIYILGSNERCALFSGINLRTIKTLVYVFSGLMCGLSAVIMVSRVSATRADLATGLELDVITAVLIGGTNINGGEGMILGTILGLFVIVILTNGLSLAGFSAIAQTIAIGVILILSVYVRTRLKATR